MGKHLEQALAFCACPPVLNWLVKEDENKKVDLALKTCRTVTFSTIQERAEETLYQYTFHCSWFVTKVLWKIRKCSCPK